MEVLTPRPTGEGQKTLFVTFYSFKGGVGRTLALLNVACILAGLGRRVLMIDFDLEAPGLTLFQDKQREEGASRKQLGLVDAIGDFLDDPWSSPLGDAEPSGFFDDYVSSLDVPEGVQKKEKEGVLDLVPAGRLDDEYENHLYDLDFEKMFEEGVGRPFFERLKDLIEDSGRYDYILVDSRTGFSDEGSISTRFLGDYLMVLTGLNRQNVRGTARFLRQSNVAERDETLALVASPVPMYYEKLRAERIDAAKTHISERAGLEKVQFVTQIPYHPVLALEEDPTVRSLEGTDLFESYEEITERLRAWAGDRPEERIERVLGLVQNGRPEDAISIFRNVKNEDPEIALQFLRSTIRILRGDHPHSVIALLEEGITAAQEIGKLESEHNLLFSLANLYGECGDLDQAVQYHEQALDRARQLGARRKEIFSLNNLGYWHLERGTMEKAIKFLRQSEELSREIGDRPVLAFSLANLGVCFAEKGNKERALGSAEEAVDIAEDLDRPSLQAKIFFDHTRAFSHLDPQQAFAFLQERWVLIQENVDAFERMEAHVLRARLRLEVENDVEGAAEDARKALDFYRERDVDSRWSREAEEILERAQTHEEPQG